MAILPHFKVTKLQKVKNKIADFLEQILVYKGKPSNGPDLLDPINAMRDRIARESARLEGLLLLTFKQAYNRKLEVSGKITLDDVYAQVNNFRIHNAVANNDYNKLVIHATDQVVYDKLVEYSHRFCNSVFELHITFKRIDGVGPAMFLLGPTMNPYMGGYMANILDVAIIDLPVVETETRKPNIFTKFFNKESKGVEDECN